MNNTSVDPRVYAGVELGGTKILCRVIDAADAVLGEGRFATSTPMQAMDDIGSCIELALAAGGAPRKLTAVGVASFGPIALDHSSPRYGRLLATPKPGWSDFDIHRALAARCGTPVALDTDVNAAAIAELRLGAGRGLGSVAYVTVGTGIGGGLATQGATLKGILHPEIGHIRVRRRAGDVHVSTCPFHDDCVEGLAAGPAIGRRLEATCAVGEAQDHALANTPTRTLSDAPEITSLVGDYLGDLAATLVLAWAPHRVIFGGGVMRAAGLLEQVGEAMRISLGDYGAPETKVPNYLVPAELSDAGLEGALLMARELG